MIEKLRELLAEKNEAFQDVMFDHLTERYDYEHACKIMGYPPPEETFSELQVAFNTFSEGITQVANDFVNAFRASGILETLEKISQVFEKDSDHDD